MTRTAAAIAVLLACARWGSLTWAQPPAPSVRLTGRPLALQPPPETREGTLLVPWAALARAGGLKATWDAGPQALQIVSASRSTVTLTATALRAGGQTTALVPAPRVAGQDLVAPLKPLCEALGWALTWDAKTRTASIWATITALTTRGDANGVLVSVATSLPTAGQVTQLIDPIRTVVDLPGVFLGDEPPTNFINLVGVQRLRAAQYSKAPPITRLVADIAGNGPRGEWQALPDKLGGKLVFGRVEGNEPIVQRPRPKLLKVEAASAGPDAATLTITLTDPIAPVYDVLRKPYRVLVDLCGAEGPAAAPAVAATIPVVDEIRFVEEGRLALYMKELVPFRLEALTKPDRLVLRFRRDHIAGKSIVVDPGHGGKDSGARGRTLLEKSVNLDVAKRTVTRLALMDAKPTLTRDSDVFVELYDRPRLANALKADLFVSVHCNAFTRPDVGSGTQTYYCTPQSKALAVALHDALWPGIGVKDGGVHQARFCVIRETEIPAVLVELLFIDNKVEEQLLAKPEVRERAAVGICEGLRRYLEGTSSLSPAPLVPPEG
jgi:N-acetylmuramoyl-L-alanine amidase